ncbi:MAG: GNAT family N-acetyltransferase [Synergistaceae bacterium]|nr:GNAT family N-acetyltransferase [Synergistaceae bacterium]
MIIRPVKKEDAAQIREISTDITVSKNMDISSINFADAENLIVKLTGFDHMLVLETETPPTEICAVLLLRVDPQIYFRRLATLETMVGIKWQGQGIGKALMLSALELADKELLLERVEAKIATENIPALKLCKSTGFKVEGIAKDWAISDDGGYIDAYLLARCKPNL